VANHSQLVGGSSAGRFVECPGSYAQIIALPPQPDSTSIFAEEGTFAHAVMDTLARKRKRSNTTNMRNDAEKLLGTKVYDREVTEKHLDELIHPAIDRLIELENRYHGGFKVAAVEARVRFPGVPAFGTADLLLVSNSHLLLVDYKFGVGVVTATYAEQDGERLNPQLLFYLTAARHTLPNLFKTGMRRPVVAIIQPRAEVQLTHTEVAPDEITQFEEDILRAVDLALGHNPPLHRGDHCKWCPAKTICPKWVGPIKELALLGKTPEQRREMASKELTPFGEYLSRAKTLATDLVEFTKELDAQLKAYLEDGGYVPGYTLQAKTKLRQWIDDDTVERALINLGFPDDAIWQRKLQTFKVADAAAKRLGVKIPDHLRVAPPTDETVVVRSDEAIAPIERPLLIDGFAASAARLSRKG